jgi:sodium-dependent phosphate transporter
MTQAIIIAAVFEFTGAMVLGQTNVNTIAGGIANRAAFNSGYGPYLFCYGMMCMLWIGGLFQLFSSFAQLNVSATHSVIGGIIGFALIHQGNSAVNWVTFDSTKVPPYGGVVPIIISWFFSPIFTGIVSYIIIVSLRTFVFHSPEVSR